MDAFLAPRRFGTAAAPLAAAAAAAAAAAGTIGTELDAEEDGATPAAR